MTDDLPSNEREWRPVPDWVDRDAVAPIELRERIEGITHATLTHVREVSTLTCRARDVLTEFNARTRELPDEIREDVQRASGLDNLLDAFEALAALAPGEGTARLGELIERLAVMPHNIDPELLEHLTPSVETVDEAEHHWIPRRVPRASSAATRLQSRLLSGRS